MLFFLSKNSLYHFRIMLILQRVHLMGNLFRCIVGQHGTFGLKDGYSFVKMPVNVMNRDSAFFLSGSNDGLMNLVAIHTLSAILRQQ